MAYEVHAVRYATHRAPKAEFFHRYHSYGEPRCRDRDGLLLLASHETADETIVVDCGFDPEAAARRGRSCLCAPIDALRELGVDPAAVSTVIVTHLHYDHIGNLAAFPAATLCVPRRELDFWTGPMASRFQFASHRRAGRDRVRGASGRRGPGAG